MKEIYLLSGLGADKRVFDFVDFSGFKINHVEWIEPQDNESIEHYSSRLLEQIKTPRPILIGVSFGGMVAVEIAKLIETDKVVLISSAKTKLDIPFHFIIAGRLGLHKVIPTKFLKTVNRLTFWFFGVKTENEKSLLRTIIQETDTKFLTWAVDKIATWKNTTSLKNLTHIHGTADKILPLRTVDFIILYGGHLMILNKGKQLSGLIRGLLRRKINSVNGSAWLLEQITSRLIQENVRHEIHKFDSGCVMVDICKDNLFYVIQIEPDLLGLSLIDDGNPGFDTFPDRTYEDFDDFKIDFERILS